MTAKKSRTHLIGLGLDRDGHKRITKGENFTIAGGSEKTHEGMTQKAIHVEEKLKRKGLTIATAEAERLQDLIGEIE